MALARADVGASDTLSEARCVLVTMRRAAAGP